VKLTIIHDNPKNWHPVATAYRSERMILVIIARIINIVWPREYLSYSVIQQGYSNGDL
jgi:hypothetical protein